MNRRSGRVFGFAAAAFMAACLLASAAGAGNPGAESLNVQPGARQLGMGGIGICAGGIIGAWHNPALLVDQTPTWEMALTGGPIFIGVPNVDSSIMGAGVGWKPAGNWALGALGSFTSIKFSEVNVAGDEGAKIGQNTGAFGVAAAYSWGWLRAGFTLKMIAEDLAGEGARAFSSDLGLLVSLGDFLAGVSVRNLGPDLRDMKTQSSTYPAFEDRENQPTEMRLGVLYRVTAWNLAMGVEIAGAPGSEGDPSPGLGAEWWIVPSFALRLGGRMMMGALYPTAGLSAVLKDFSLDYGWAAHPVGGVHRIGLTYAFGKAPVAEAAPAPEPRREAAPAQVQPAPRPAGGRLNFAVADLSAQGVSSSDSAVIADLLRSELVKTGAFNVIEKQNMEKVLAEHAFQQTGCTTEECAVRLGKLLNVQRMAVGSFGKLLDSYFLNIRVVNVETGAVLFGDSAEGRTVSDLKVAVRDLANRMARQVR